jgi:hypothetical protein
VTRWDERLCLDGVRPLVQSVDQSLQVFGHGLWTPPIRL